MTEPKTGNWSEYLDRARFLANVINPLNLLATRNRIEQAKSQRDDGSRALVAARVHPDTGNLIPVPFSLPAIIPANLLIVMGMLRPNQTNKTIAFWQIFNQSINTGVNWANANKSGGEQTSAELLKSYTVSVMASCAMSMGFNRLAVLWQSALLRSLAPLCGVLGANVVNVGVMRGREVVEGIAVKDRDGGLVGVSQLAAQQAITHTIISRNLVAVALLALPPLTIYGLRGVLAGKPAMARQLVEAAVVLGWMVPSVPLGIALYPQLECVDITDLEPRLHGKVGDNKVFFNRGF